MADLETAGATLLLKLKELEGHADDARQALQDGEEEVQQARQQVTDDGSSLVDEANQALGELGELHTEMQEEGEQSLQVLRDLQQHVAAAEATLRQELEAEEQQAAGFQQAFEQQAAELLGGLDAIEQRAHAVRDQLHQLSGQLDHVLDDARELLAQDFAHAADIIAEDLDLVARHVHEAVSGAVAAIDPMGDDWQQAVHAEWQDSLHQQGLDTVRANLDTVVKAAEDGFRQVREAALGELPPAAARLLARAQGILEAVLSGAEVVDAASPIERDTDATAEAVERVVKSVEELYTYLGRLSFE